MRINQYSDNIEDYLVEMKLFDYGNIFAAEWFHSKWGVPTDAYLQCMDAYLDMKTEYGWFKEMMNQI